LHPSAAVLLWLAGVLSAQSLDYAGGVLLLALVFCTAQGVVAVFLRFAKKSRWLLLMLWLVFAYGKPGEALFQLDWAPTLEGIAEANLHLFRLLLMLASLAWLFARLTREQLMAAIWGLLKPLMKLGMDVERLVVRLSLVIAHLADERPVKDWRRMLIEDNNPAERPGSIQISMPSWTFLDSLLVFSAFSCTLWIVLA